MTEDKEINTHGMTIGFGRHEGTLYTKLPLSYLRWMINNMTQDHEIAAAEIRRRGAGHDMPAVEISGHAIDRASQRCLNVWKKDRKHNEGLHAWLSRVTLEAKNGHCRVVNGKHRYKGMRLVIAEGEFYDTLVTVTRDPRRVRR